MNNTTSTTMVGHSTPTVGWDPASLPKMSVTASSGSLNISSTITTANAGSVLTVANGTSNWSTITVNTDIPDFCELVLAAIGCDIKYEDFQKMSKEERKSLLRDIKIKRVLD